MGLFSFPDAPQLRLGRSGLLPLNLGSRSTLVLVGTVFLDQLPCLGLFGLDRVSVETWFFGIDSFRVCPDALWAS